MHERFHYYQCYKINNYEVHECRRESLLPYLPMKNRSPN